jgi:hypothetical protein
MATTNTTYIKGMTSQMQDAYRRACIRAFGADKNGAPLFVPRLVQGYGDAPDSKGTHDYERDKDNKALMIAGKPYCCALDISIKGWTGHFKQSQQAAIKWFLYCLAEEGFVGWYRYRRSFFKNQHMHIVYVGHKMKRSLINQVKEFFVGGDGLVGDEKEPFWTPPASAIAGLKLLFQRNN